MRDLVRALHMKWVSTAYTWQVHLTHIGGEQKQS
jgi:hypothetical protein